MHPKWLLVFIIVIASFFRLWQLDKIPPGIWPDEAMNTTNAIQALESGKFKVFYPENHGREGLFINLIALSFAVFGISIWSFKIVPALIGIFTVIGQYFLTKEIFQFLSSKIQNTSVALLSAFLLAISFWHVNFSRIDFRAIMVPFVLVWSFYFLFRGIRTKKLFSFILAGLFFGAGFHTYISFRLAVLALGFLLFWWFFIALREHWIKQYIIALAAFLSTIFLIALPIGLYFSSHPEDFFSRALGVSVFEQKHPLEAFGKSLAVHLGMFSFYGDQNWRHNFPPIPQLSHIGGIFFLIGIGYAISQLVWAFRSMFQNSPQEKSKYVVLFGIYAFFFVWFFSLLLPTVLTVEGIPHALRSIGVIPVAYIFMGLGISIFLNKGLSLVTSCSKGRTLAGLFLLLLAASSFFTYFVAWAKHPEVEKAFTKRFVDVGRKLNELPREITKYVIKSEGDLPTEVSKFIQKTSGRSDAIYINPEETVHIKASRGDVILTMNKDLAPLEVLRKQFPQGQLYEFKRFWMYEIR